MLRRDLAGCGEGLSPWPGRRGTPTRTIAETAALLHDCQHLAGGYGGAFARQDLLHHAFFR